MGYQRGIGDSNINPTTIWTPSTGFLNTPGTLAGGYQYQPQVTSVYDVPGLLLPAPACTQANAGAFVSPGCVEQALAIEQQNFQRTADYNAGKLKLPGNPPPASPPPTPPATPGVCAQPNYYNASGVCVDPFSGNPIAGVPTKTPAPPAPPAPHPPAPSGGSSSDSGGGTTGGSTTNYVAPSTDFLTTETSVAGFNVPVWGLLAAGAAALFFLGGRH